jgi:hypothetical protein
MPTFKPPYGTGDQHVTNPARHRGYRYLVAYLVDGGLRADYVARACIEAEEEGAPKDAVCHTQDGWKRRGDLTNQAVGRRLDSYATALTQYEKELKAERASERST